MTQASNVPRVVIHGARGRMGQALLRLAPERGVHVVIARVVEGNAGSRALHDALGFQTLGVMRRCGEKFGRLS